MTAVLVGTAAGLRTVAVPGGVEGPLRYSGRHITGLEGPLVLLDGRTVHDGDSVVVSVPAGPPEATCLGGGFVGTAEAHLYGAPGLVTSFDEAPGRSTWYTPWGGPPDTRSISAAADGTTYVNVHVGGILRSDDSGASWEPTIDVDADVHQVLAGPEDGEVLAATAYGLARSRDRGATWTFLDGGLHAGYCRAVAVAGDWVLVSASTGPGSRQGALYRRPLGAADAEPFVRCSNWFEGNVDTGGLAGGGAPSQTVAVDLPGGRVLLSTDAGATWSVVGDGFGRVTCVGLAPTP